MIKIESYNSTIYPISIMITRRYPVWILPRFFCALSLTEECFLFQQNPCFIYHRHNPLHLYAYIRCATYARDGRGLCRRCDGINILFIDFLPLFRHLTLSMLDAACGNGEVFYTPKHIMFSESISKCKNSRYVLNT